MSKVIMDVMLTVAKATAEHSVEKTTEELVSLRNTAFCIINIPGYSNFLRRPEAGNNTPQEIRSMIAHAPVVLFRTQKSLELKKQNL